MRPTDDLYDYLDRKASAGRPLIDAMICEMIEDGTLWGKALSVVSGADTPEQALVASSFRCLADSAFKLFLVGRDDQALGLTEKTVEALPRFISGDPDPETWTTLARTLHFCKFMLLGTLEQPEGVSIQAPFREMVARKREPGYEFVDHDLCFDALYFTYLYEGHARSTEEYMRLCPFFSHVGPDGAVFTEPCLTWNLGCKDYLYLLVRQSLGDTSRSKGLGTYLLNHFTTNFQGWLSRARSFRIFQWLVLMKWHGREEKPNPGELIRKITDYVNNPVVPKKYSRS